MAGTKWLRKLGCLLLLAWFSSGVSPAAAQAAAPTPDPTRPSGAQTDPIPKLAYYYIWFDPSSWNRAKTDYPILGKYSSSDVDVMRQHIRWAKSAGLAGFIVSWKNTPVLSARLRDLVRVADESDFKLAIIYQGLDFQRNPLPASRVAADLDYFTSNFASDPAFNLFGKPLVIWSGTWKFSETDIAAVTAPRREKLLILASEKNAAGYRRVARLVDGDAYYWSSVNPDTNPDYGSKLVGMADAIHAEHGLWIAPAAAGFDARLIGGKTVVDRANGNLLRQEVATALSSNPDAVGIISWNEFSENSYIEPSQKYGMLYLDVLKSIHNTASPQVAEFDSSAPGNVRTTPISGNVWVALGGFAVLSIASLAVLGWRQHHQR